MLLTQTSHLDYEELCRLDVLGLADTPQHDQGQVYSEFREQLSRNEAGWYEASLPWKGNHPPLPTNEQGSLRRLQTIKRKLQRSGLEQAYTEIIEEQKSEGVVEVADQEAQGVECCIPHKPVVKDSAETTKICIVYDGSAKAHADAVSLNDCLYTGPSLQNNLWSVLVRERMHPVAITGDLKKAFLQVRVKEQDRDALRFHWRADDQSNIETLRFTRALFGLALSPFLLGSVIEHHLDSWESRKPQAVAELRESLYVDDLLSGGTTVEEAKELKQQAIEIFGDATFTLHKWHSNERDLEEPAVPNDKEETYAKQQLGGPKGAESSMLGLAWNKERDEIRVSFPETKADVTKRGVLRKLASIYDPLGLASPVTLEGKLLYRAICDEKIASQIAKSVEKVGRSPTETNQRPKTFSRTQTVHQIHSFARFGDASGYGVGATVFAVVEQEAGINQRLVAAKARLAKQGLTIPRLEMVSAHVVTNVLANVKDALKGFPVVGLHGWIDSTVVLLWIKGRGQYKQFVENRVRKIQAKSEITWRHVLTEMNPADLASRGGSVEHRELWWNGPEWMANPEHWPQDIVRPVVCRKQSRIKGNKGTLCKCHRPVSRPSAEV